jgi:hypothetical protein
MAWYQVIDAVQCHHPPRTADYPSEMRQVQDPGQLEMNHFCLGAGLRWHSWEGRGHEI